MSEAKFDSDDFENKAPDLLADLAKNVVQTTLELTDVDEDTAENIGMIVAMRIAQSWGGLNFYMPKSMSLLACPREKQIFNEFNGVNHKALAKKFKISVPWVYKIVKKVQKEEVAKRQLGLFEEK
ncbi:Mor transcription activator family protein [Pasteurella skyensis]|uniref:Mor transcription activator family protein n=1 Tax=Phocoenobacter skyensis TaxID=97481 RepID=A0AAJ6P0H2_9PAST|nr:Mor transcription activator family protein [Pasteurella skyensis]MDP8162838.1 Mor transcription activator family protein [Pasteurella skyensis]MDP8172575.1 Mor transcription activator family protein [Pasteurella skyensis]MDP8179075.1 Mor transcription activator family protein [Pasteurella skyensis]MDP8183240.1 Mor transcription activator family protein [Pasteurella skyensis]MDP8189291.1 Mor transcription activator family protein [Pasteurella skyensis]